MEIIFKAWKEQQFFIRGAIVKKQLSEMSLEELWQLFPIILKEHKPEYKKWYEVEKKNLLAIIDNEMISRISHIGSSAVTGLISKPTIDILMEMDGTCNVSQLTEILKANDWVLMLKQSEPEMKMVFNKGYTPDGFAEKVYHLHVRYFGDWNELYFRDYLIIHPEVSAEYGKLKMSLWKEFKHNRDYYTDAKTEFVVKHSELAKMELANKYKPR